MTPKTKSTAGESNPVIPSQNLKLEDQPQHALTLAGSDEMNLAEFPFASLRRRGDSRKAIIYEGWTTDKDGNRLQQKWTVQGGSVVGLPTEFDERVYVALMAITTRENFESRKVPFSVYEILKIMRLTNSKRDYQHVEHALDRLQGVSIKAEGAFWDNETKELVRTVLAFGLVDEYWLSYREKNKKVREREGVPAYILWNERIWKSIQDRYVKSLDIGFYFNLKNPLTRRLYRLLDKRLWKKGQYEFDIFDLAAKLGMVHYKFPAEIRKKIKPAIAELISSGFLAGTQSVKSNGYSRIRFIKSTTAPGVSVKKEQDSATDLPVARLQTKTPQEALREGLVFDLTTLGVNPQTAQELVTTYSGEVIEKWLDALSQMQEQGKAKDNPAGFLIHVLKTKTPPPPGSKTKAQQDRVHAKEEERHRQVDAQMAAYKEQERIEQEERQAQVQHLQELVGERRAYYQTTDEHIHLWEQVQHTESLQDILVLPSVYLLSLNGTIAILGVQNNFVASQVREHDHRLKQELKQLGHTVERIAFEELKKSP